MVGPRNNIGGQWWKSHYRSSSFKLKPGASTSGCLGDFYCTLCFSCCALCVGDRHDCAAWIAALGAYRCHNGEHAFLHCSTELGPALVDAGEFNLGAHWSCPGLAAATRFDLDRRGGSLCRFWLDGPTGHENVLWIGPTQLGICAVGVRVGLSCQPDLFMDTDGEGY